jgi:hypothetical protein
MLPLVLARSSLECKGKSNFRNLSCAVTIVTSADFPFLSSRLSNYLRSESQLRKGKGRAKNKTLLNCEDWKTWRFNMHCTVKGWGRGGERRENIFIKLSMRCRLHGKRVARGSTCYCISYPLGSNKAGFVVVFPQFDAVLKELNERCEIFCCLLFYASWEVSI